METISRNEIQYIKIRILERHHITDQTQLAKKKKKNLQNLPRMHTEMKDIKEVKRPEGKNKKC